MSGLQKGFNGGSGQVGKGKWKIVTGFNICGLP